LLVPDTFIFGGEGRGERGRKGGGPIVTGEGGEKKEGPVLANPHSLR